MLRDKDSGVHVNYNFYFLKVFRLLLVLNGFCLLALIDHSDCMELRLGIYCNAFRVCQKNVLHFVPK